MKFIDKLERKFGRYAIHNFMNYVVVLYVLGVVINVACPQVYTQYLGLNMTMILKGQIWRLFTFVLQPIGSFSSPLDIIFLFISVYLYYMIGNSLENAWGAFRFNLYFLSGILFNILAAVVMYFIWPGNYTVPASLDYINQSMFFAFAAMYPNVQLLLYFIIPIKVKYLGYLYAGFMIFNTVQYAVAGYWGNVIVIVFAFANFMIFFFSSRNFKKISPNEIRRKQRYRRQVRQDSYGNVTQFRGKNVVSRHKCAVCGRTELDDDNLEFRFCSKCEGNYEYCMDHLFTHEHVKKH